MKDMMTINIQKCENGFTILTGTNTKDLSEEVDILICLEDWLFTEKIRVYNELIKRDEIQSFRKNNWGVKE